MELDRKIAECSDVSSLLRSVLEARKKAKKQGSLSWLGSCAGIKSKGYSSDVMSGRRTLNPRYLDGLCVALEMSQLASVYFQLLVQYEHGGSSDASLWGRIASVRKSLKVAKKESLTPFKDIHLAFDIYAAFGLYENQPTSDDLISYFGQRICNRVQLCLKYLTDMGLIEEKNGRYHLRFADVVFAGSLDRDFHFRYLEASLQDAEEQMTHWFSHKEVAFFESAVISVDRITYEKWLRQMRAYVQEAKTSIESEQANMLVRFNVQIYPARH